MTFHRPNSENQKIYTVLEILGRKNPTLNAIEKTENIFKNPILTAHEKIEKILSEVIFIKHVTDDKKQIATMLITNNLKLKDFLTTCKTCKNRLQKHHFTILKIICDFCVNNQENGVI